MDVRSLTPGGARFSARAATLLVATLMALALVLAFATAKPSGAADAILTVDQTEVGFGAEQVEGSVLTRTITVTNTGSDPITIGGVDLAGDAGEILDFTTSIDPANGLKVDGGGTNTFTISFDPSAAGTRDAVLTLLEGLVDGTTGNLIGLTGQPVGLVSETGQTVQGINLSGSGTQGDPIAQPGAQADCDIVGTPQGETLTGTSNPETICGLGGGDKINGLGANDIMRGGAGNDRIIDKKGKDKLLGQGGRDVLNAKDGQRGDLLKGGGGKDRAAKNKGDKARSI